jgi:hypothetical protein
MTLRAVLALGFALASVGVHAADGPAKTVDGAQSAPITPKNWSTHTTIVAIRSLVADVDAAIESGKWNRKTHEECESKSGPFYREERTAIRDASGHVRKYVGQRGGGDSANTLKHWYDANGRLRFAYGTAGAIGDPESGGHSYIEYRLYFTEDGQLVWQDRKVDGPFRPWMDGFQKRMLMRDPETALAAKLVCPEG